MQAGIGRAVITPELPVMLAGFGDRTEPATELHDDLEVRALYLSSGRQAVCLLVCDLLGMSPSYSWPIRQAVAADLALPESAVLTASTHTHAAPSCIAGSEAVGWPTPAGYDRLLVESCRRAAAEAKRKAGTASLGFRTAPLPGGLSVNRRGHPYEPWFSFLDIRTGDEAEPGGRIGVLANFAIHPVALGPECQAVSSDWVGPFRDALEARLGGGAMMLSGSLGDVNPRHVHRQFNECKGDGFAEAEELGRELAEVVAAELHHAEPLGDSVEVLRSLRLDAPVGDTMLAQLSADGSMTADLVEWSIGGARLVSIPGEGFHALGRAILESRPGPVLLAGLAPVWQGYLPMPYTEGYEESMSLGRPFVDAVAAALLEART